MIGGQQLDLEGGAPLAHLHALKTGALFSASVMCGLWAAEVPASEHGPWRAFAGELGLLFQIVDDVLDGDGYVLDVGEEGARRLADEAAERAQARLAALDADTSVLEGIVEVLAVRVDVREAAGRAARRARPRRVTRAGAGARDGGPRARACEGRASRSTRTRRSR